MSPPVPVVLHPVHPRGVSEALAAIEAVSLIEPADDDRVAAAMADAEVLVTFRWRPDFLGPGLRWVQSISAGVEQFPLTELAAAGVVLTSATGIHGPQVAEHAFALLLALTRNVGISMREAQSRTWRQRMGYEIGGRTLGVLGLGTIGEEVARRGRAWGMEVIGTKARPDGYQGAASRVYGPDGTLEVMARAEAVIVTLPDTPATRGVVREEALAALGPGWLVNVGRGPSVDEGALLRALDDGELRGAGLDVFVAEPLPEDSPLWLHPRVVITPHSAGFSPAYGPRLAELFEANLDAHLGKGEWVTRVA